MLTLAVTSTGMASSAADTPAAPVLLALAVILAVAKLGGDLAARVKQPSVLGSLSPVCCWAIWH